MSKIEKPTGEKSKQEQMLDAILGADDEFTNDEAADILALYGLSDNDLIDSFKASMSRELAQLPLDSKEGKQLGGTLRHVRVVQMELTGEKLTPKERISRLVGGLLSPTVSASYAFREKTDGELPDTDKKILDDLRKELLDRSEHE